MGDVNSLWVVLSFQRESFDVVNYLENGFLVSHVSGCKAGVQPESWDWAGSSGSESQAMK